MSTLTTTQLAQYLGLSPLSIGSILVRRPDRLPPPCRVPGSRRLIWLKVDVDNWLMQHRQTDKPKRGRPTKVEQKRKLELGAGHE